VLWRILVSYGTNDSWPYCKVWVFFPDIFVPNSLIDSYSKCGLVGANSARKFFMVMGERDIVSWNYMIGGLVKAGKLVEARQ
jgi:hypothetical protein